jgi:hypothetical protein
MPDKALVKQLLRSARDKVAASWIQGHYQDGGSVCAVGGLRVAFSELLGDEVNEELDAVFIAALKAMAYQVEEDSNGVDRHTAEGIIIQYNDTRRRKKQDVIEKFDAAIECLEKEDV